MRELPILFSGAMVRAILDGRKTQTRRVIAKQPFDRSWSRHDHRIQYVSGRAENQDETDGFHAYSTSSGGEWHAKSPFGQPGDPLWLRETFSGPWCMEAQEGRAAAPPSKWGAGSRIWYWADGNPSHGDWTKPRPSIHMPRWASRILLEVTDVRVERLQAITEADARAEGLPWSDGEPDERGVPTALVVDARDEFRHLWDSLNAARGHGWDTNPWVWVVSFKRLEPAR